MSNFQAALSLAREHRTVGALPHEIDKAIAERSALVDAVNKALNVGNFASGATIAVALIGARAEDFGSRP
jgi:hypothetical protein